ncbi:hypothetical protein ACJJTC_017735 [Scirpophaga incertulas]
MRTQALVAHEMDQIWNPMLRRDRWLSERVWWTRRRTPRNGLDSPAQMLMGRRLKTKLPITTSLLKEPVDNCRNYKTLIEKNNYIKEMYDKSSRPLQQIYPGDKAVLVCPKDNRKHVKIVAKAAQPRSYIVEDEFGNKFRRTRSHLVVRNMSKTGIGVSKLQRRWRRCAHYKKDSEASTLCFGHESSGSSSMANDGYASPLQSPPPPNVSIERKRTERMLLNLNKD